MHGIHVSPLLRPRLPRPSPDGDDGGGSGGGDSTPAGTTPVTPEVTPATTPPPVAQPATFSQDEVNRLIGKARDEGKKQAADEAKRKQTEDEAKAKGEWEKVAQAKEAEVADLKAQLANRDRALLVAKVAALHKLPSELADRLQGDDEAALDADAKALAKVVAARPAPDTEAGSGTNNGAANGGRPKPKTPEGPVYAFDGTKKVAWPNR